MAYDWRESISSPAYTREWFEEVDRRFFDAAYFARGPQGEPFGQYLRPQMVERRAVLEIGCGMGSHAALVARRGANLTAIDITKPAVEATRRRFELFGLTANILQADAEELPFPDNSFDVVWSWGVLHHSASFERCLSQVNRVLRPGGNLLLMVYHRRSIFFVGHCGLIRGVLLGQLLRRSLQDIYSQNSDGAYARLFSKSELRGLLDRDYKPLAISVVGQKNDLLPIPGSRLKARLERALPDQVASPLLERWGFFLVAEGVKLT